MSDTVNTDTQLQRICLIATINTVVMELQMRRVEGRKIALDLLELTMHKKGANRAKKQEIRRRKEMKVCNLLYSVNDKHTCDVVITELHTAMLEYVSAYIYVCRC